jgi:hypothetical protein
MAVKIQLNIEQMNKEFRMKKVAPLFFPQSLLLSLVKKRNSEMSGCPTSLF